jgi:hypothetical protein
MRFDSMQLRGGPDLHDLTSERHLQYKNVSEICSGNLPMLVMLTFKNFGIVCPSKMSTM